MKRKFSKILGVGLTLALATSLLLSAVPVMAEVGDIIVDVANEDISANTTYTISFRISEDLVDGDDVIISFPDDTDADAAAIAATAVVYTSGIGYNSGNSTAATLAVDADDPIVTVDLATLGGGGIGAMAYVEITLTGIVNPTEPGDFTLEVKTSVTDQKSYIESAPYEIEVPTVGGFVYVYNPSDILLATYGGEEALDNAVTDLRFAGEDYTIEVGTGTYILTADIDITGEGLTLISADGAEDTVIDADTFGITITNADEVTIDGFTIDDAGTAITIGDGVVGSTAEIGDDAVITNCVITDATVGVLINIDAMNATISDNTIEDCATGIEFFDGAVTDLDDLDITGNTITEANTNGAIVIGGGAGDIDITGNTITDNEIGGILFNGTLVNDNIAISGNTISLNEGDGITYSGTAAATKVSIVDNTIIDNDDDGINLTTAWTYASCYAMFNTIMDNGDNANNGDGTDDLNARFNWWGTDDDDDFDVSDDVEVEPWLMSEGAADGFKVATANAALDGRSDAGVSVTGMDDDAGNAADVMSAFTYDSNPADDIDDAIAFYDLFVLADAIVSPDEVNAKVKLYDTAITEDSVAYFWTGDFWAECSDQIARSGLVWVDITEDTIPAIDDLEGTPFAVVAGDAVGGVDEPVLLTPTIGDDEVSLSPAFAWSSVADADTYYFELADNAQFVVPLVKMSDDLSALMVTNFGYAGMLDYATPYYWRVKAIGDDGMSDWASGVFVAMSEPEETRPPIVVEEQAPVVIEPIVEVITPAATAVTPGWIYAIIAVGAVLVIALLVLIVRTRRVS
ncbi:right-handed parallel beta-helix repeat-containing protein [Chloroflexota bacterium]